MNLGDLIYANVLDQRVYDAQGKDGQPGVYLMGLPGRPLPFVLYRAWKMPDGFMTEEIRLTGPSGRLIYRWGPNARRMGGTMTQTIEADVIDDALFDEQGMYLASFILEGQIVGEIEVPVMVQAAPEKLDKDVEEGLKKSDIVWVGAGDSQRGEAPLYADQKIVPAWFAYKNGKILVLSQKEAGPGEQTIPGLADADEMLVITRMKLRDTARDRFWADVRLLEGAEFENAAKVLVDRRRSRVGPPADSLARWRKDCVIAELTPVLG